MKASLLVIAAAIFALFTAGASSPHLTRTTIAIEGVPLNLVRAMKVDEVVLHNLVTALKAEEGVPQNLLSGADARRVKHWAIRALVEAALKSDF